MILVVGATGTLGGRITRGLLKQGKAVRILVRDPSPSVELAAMGLATHPATLVEAGAQPITGDLIDRVSLSAACAGIDTVISTATAAKRGGDLETVDLQGTRNLIEAATKAGVSQFIYTSAFGSAPGHAVPMFHIKGTCEQALMDSGLTWTILRPGIFYEVLVGMVIGIPLQAGEPVSLPADGQRRHAYISEADVADFAVAAVGNPVAFNACLDLGGPSYSWREIVAAAEGALGRKLTLRFTPAGSELPLLGPEVSAWLTGYETYDDFIDMGDAPARFGVRITPLSSVMSQMFAQAFKGEVSS